MATRFFARKFVHYRTKIRSSVLAALESLIERIVIPRAAKKWVPTTPDERWLGQRVLFVGYGSPIGRLGHKVVAQHIRNLGGEAEHLLPIEVCPTYSRHWRKNEDAPGQLFDTASALTDFLVTHSRGEYFFKRGLIDEYIRRAPRSFFIGRNWLPDAFLEMAHRVLDDAGKLMAKYSALVLVDTAYLQKSSLVSAAKSQGKPVWALDPAGGWRKIADADKDRLERDWFSAAEQAIRKRTDVLIEAKEYARNRFAGNVGSDIDVHFVYGAAASYGEDEPRKVLFLHAIRDSAGLPLKQTDRGELFATFLEWASQALEYVAEEPGSWWIKPHPQKFLFPDENKIVQELMAEYAIPIEILRPDLNTKWVLSNRLPIYTHSGTIAVEAAVHGYRAHVCSGMYSDRISQVSSTLDEMARNYRLPFADAAENIDDPKDVGIAQILLFQRFQLAATELSPTAIPNFRSSTNSFELAERRQTFELLWRYRKRPAQVTARKIAHEILNHTTVS